MSSSAPLTPPSPELATTPDHSATIFGAKVTENWFQAVRDLISSGKVRCPAFEKVDKLYVDGKRSFTLKEKVLMRNKMHMKQCEEAEA